MEYFNFDGLPQPTKNKNRYKLELLKIMGTEIKIQAEKFNFV
jgi:hypothetical protein